MTDLVYEYWKRQPEFLPTKFSITPPRGDFNQFINIFTGGDDTSDINFDIDEDDRERVIVIDVSEVHGGSDDIDDVSTASTVEPDLLRLFRNVKVESVSDREEIKRRRRSRPQRKKRNNQTSGNKWGKFRRGGIDTSHTDILNTEMPDNEWDDYRNAESINRMDNIEIPSEDENNDVETVIPVHPTSSNNVIDPITGSDTSINVTGVSFDINDFIE